MAAQEGLVRRGRVFHLRLRTPIRYRSVEPRAEVTLSLRTDSLVEARARQTLARRALHDRWAARLDGREACVTEPIWAAARDAGPTSAWPQAMADPRMIELLERLGDHLAAKPATAVQDSAPTPPTLPIILVSEMPCHHERLRIDRIAAKNGRQLREWRNKYLRAAQAFVDAVADKPMGAIERADARAYRSHWEAKRISDGLTTDYVNKQINYMAQLAETFIKIAGLLPADHPNAFAGLALEKQGRELRQEEGRKLALPVGWIRDVLLNPSATPGLNAEARDIAVVCAETGARIAEVVDLAPEDIVLDHEIPHLRLLMVEEGEHKRELKNVASKREIPLLGHALDAMRRNPGGFERYRGRATYYATINKYLREQKLFPDPPKGEGRGYSIGGARHTYEDRMLHAGIGNEERALLMGHSLRSLRGRPVYGGAIELRLRALLAEMIVFPTARWTPRTHAELDAEVDRLLVAAGYRRR